MPCLAAPPFPAPPGLPAGLTIPLYPGFNLAAIGLCCAYQFPPYGSLALAPAIPLPIALPTAIVVAYLQLVAALTQLWALLAIPCPTE